MTGGEQYTISVGQGEQYGNYKLHIEGDGIDISMASTPKEEDIKTVWRLASSEETNEATIVREFSYDTNGNSITVTETGNGNGVMDDWAESETYQWDEAKQCLLSSSGKAMYYNEWGQLTSWENGSDGTTGTYTYDSMGYPSTYDVNDGNSVMAYYSTKTELENGNVQLDWYSDDEQLTGTLMWSGIYQHGYMIEYDYRYLEPYTITFEYEEVEWPTDKGPAYFFGSLITPNEYM